VCGTTSEYDESDEDRRVVVFEARVRLRDAYFVSKEDEAAMIADALSVDYDVESVEVTIISDTDPSTGITHFEGMESS
jgi:hypothetical protein